MNHNEIQNEKKLQREESSLSPWNHFSYLALNIIYI